MELQKKGQFNGRTNLSKTPAKPSFGRSLDINEDLIKFINASCSSIDVTKQDNLELEEDSPDEYDDPDA